MVDRRQFMAAGGVGLASVALTEASRADDTPSGGRDLYEVRHYHYDNEAQRGDLDTFFREAVIPAWNRIGVGPVGAFVPVAGERTLTFVMRHRSMETVVAETRLLLADSEFLTKGARFIDAPADRPLYRRIESSLLLAFKGMPTLEVPAKGPDRVYQLRVYESPSVKTGQKKIEMFNDAGEIAIFRRTGLQPVFFGEALVGAKLPNLTYMLTFENEDALKAHWKTFIDDPEWKRVSAKPEYANKAILSGITNTVLRATDYSQV